MEPGIAFSFGPISPPEYLSKGDKVNQLEQQMKRMQQKIGSLEEKYGLKAEEFKEKELKQQENIRLLSENIKMKDEKIEHLQSQKAKLDEKTNDLREKAKENELLKQKIQSLEEEKLKLENYRNPSEYQLQEILALERELNELKAKYNREKEALEKELNCLQEEKQKIEGKLAEVIEEKNQFRYQLEKANEELKELRASNKKQKDIQSSLENQIETLNKELANSKHRQDPELEAKLRQLKKSILQQMEVLKTQGKALREKRQQLEKEISDIIAEKSKLQEALDEFERQLAKLSSAHNFYKALKLGKREKHDSLRDEVVRSECKKDMLEEGQKQLQTLHDTPESMMRQICTAMMESNRKALITVERGLPSLKQTKEEIRQEMLDAQEKQNNAAREWHDVSPKISSAKTSIVELDKRELMQQGQVTWIEHQIQVLNENKATLEKQLKRMENFVQQILTID